MIDAIEAAHRFAQGRERADLDSDEMLVHADFDVDRDILWATVTQALPTLLKELQAAREGRPRSPGHAAASSFQRPSAQ